MQPSDTFRSRRAPSPLRQTLTTGLPAAQPRFVQPRYPLTPEFGQDASFANDPPLQAHSTHTYASHPYMDADAKLEAVRHEGRSSIATSVGTVGRRVGAGLGGRMTAGEWKVLAVVTFIAFAVRLFRISKPDSVVFDEVHFGKFAGKYIRTRYYVDVHPPLAKLLITLAAWVGGFDGNFDFKDIGLLFPPGVPYVMMRLLPASLGVALIPITYLTLRSLDCTATSSLLGSVLVLFENGLVTQSRHILLDSPLVFFTALSAMFWVAFCAEDRKHPGAGKGQDLSWRSKKSDGPFSYIWWAYLFLTGMALGAVTSCKWVGLFTIATVGFSTCKQLWTMIGDLSISPRTFFRHFMARAICLIAVPIMFYMLMFQIHFSILRNSGDGDAFMSSEFQHTLDGKSMQDTYADVAFGSTISLRHVNTQGGYLHSHPHNYPGGSKQQQITLYPHQDANNDWIIVPGMVPDKKPEDNSTEVLMSSINYIKPGTIIRLEHAKTGKHLHSHDVRPPVSEVDFQNEISGYGFEGFDGDANDNFIVEIDEEDGHGGPNGSGWGGDKESATRLRTLRTKFKLRHQYTGCYLFSHKVKLPDWGFEQQEVTCNKNAVRLNSLWYIETNSNKLLPPNAPKVNYQTPGFLGKFWELQKVMWQTNAGLTSRHAYDSRPHHWPWLRRGINFWVKDHRHIYLIGNAFTWWISTASIALYVAVRGLLIIRYKRGYKDFHHSAAVKYDQLIGFLVMGWALHYFPFFLMGRQLFLHHYFPALWFSILVFCAVFDLLTSTTSPRRRLQIAAVIMALAIWTFAHFSPLAYGNPWTKQHCRDAKWLNTWDFSCNDYLDNYDAYKHIKPAAHGPDPTTAAQVVPTADATIAPVVPKPVEKKPDELTKEALKPKVEPGHDIFAQPANGDDAQKVPDLAATGPGAKDAEKKEKEKSAKMEEVKSQLESLEDQVGPLLPSDLAKVGAEREEKKVQEKEDKKDDKEAEAEAKKMVPPPDEKKEKTDDGADGVDPVIPPKEGKKPTDDGADGVDPVIPPKEGEKPTDDGKMSIQTAANEKSE